eukprot:TRINITY_DN4272_c0_g3_i3.p1 TRINITY_DN4272_c0_g3~~TRINITY_DN4272_c0_g3_i3.p1  ORF type:complete len:155 (+),score=18.48 TRINITY_DN4272_c0_g3_i3:447-911(+)
MYTGYYTGFSEADDSLLSLLSLLVGAKLAQVRETALALHKDKLTFNTLSGICTLLTNRNCLSFMISLKDTFPLLFGCECLGIYLYASGSTFGVRDSRGALHIPKEQLRGRDGDAGSVPLRHRNHRESVQGGPRSGERGGEGGKRLSRDRCNGES